MTVAASASGNRSSALSIRMSLSATHAGSRTSCRHRVAPSLRGRRSSTPSPPRSSAVVGAEVVGAEVVGAEVVGAEVVGAEVVFGARSVQAASCALGGGASSCPPTVTTITATATFAKLDSTEFAFIPEAPQLIPPLPYDFFYPFTHAAR